MKTIRLALVDYPDCLKSAVFGLSEMFHLANRRATDCTFEVHILSGDIAINDPAPHFDIIIIPPNLGSSYAHSPSNDLIDWLTQEHQKGSILCAACAGTFLLAQTGLLDGKDVTTHWALADQFKKQFTNPRLDVDKILINNGNIITAGGLMAWVDLGLEIIAHFASPALMRTVGKTLVVDTSLREQKFYKSFRPNRNHADKAILSIQDKIQNEIATNFTIKGLAAACYLGERTFLRRFKKCCGLTPAQYIQCQRIQKACDLLEETNLSVAEITHQIGYEDISAFRRTFIKITGLTPRDFRNRFGTADTSLNMRKTYDLGDG